MRKLGMYLVVLVLSFSLIQPVQAATTWDVTGTGANPYTLTFTGDGTVNLKSETELVFEDGVTGQTIDVAKTPVVTFTATTAPTVTVVSADDSKTIVIKFGREVVEEPTTEEPVTEEPTADEPTLEEPVEEQPVKEAPAKETAVETATITGLAWYDENMDGIRQPDERLIDDLRILLLDHDADVEEEITTKDGKYTFANLLPGDYTLAVDGYDLGYYNNSPQHVGKNRTVDSDFDEVDSLVDLTLKAGEVAVVDAGMYGDEGDEDFSNLVTIANFVDENANHEPDGAEISVPATYTVTDTITGSVVYKDKVTAEEAMLVVLDPGNYIIKTELPAGYTVKTMHRTAIDNLDNSESFSTAKSKAGMKAMAEEAAEDVFAKGEFARLFKHEAPGTIIKLTEETTGFMIIMEVVRTKEAPAEPVKPNETPTKVTTTSETKADDVTTGQLPQAGESKPFPFAATGLGIAVVGLWLMVRRNG
ncbi:SdrD B-like domain-containing protein [Exiguobacterium sp. s193]|uniref:SdrD B-like domain-containing protein n=1 Tax=Exiguobacterium sp. s193 TaxID=2751207 RepID=UPI001BE92897|nr:SdrD B-like domain-containing protein [Exiguobacterium sp. s193]